MIISQLTLPPACPKQVSTDLVRAPRTERPRYRTHWDEAGIVSYRNLVSSQLQQVRQAWLDRESKVLTYVLLQSTNHVLSTAACTTNQSTLLDAKPSIVKLHSNLQTQLNFSWFEKELTEEGRKEEEEPSPSF